MYLPDKLINGNFSEFFLKFLSEYCEKDKKNRLEVALELYAGKRKNACFKCMFVNKTAVPIINRLFYFFKILPPELERSNEAPEDYKKRHNFLEVYSTNPHIMKFISTNIKGLADFGLKIPIVPAAPLQVLLETTYRCNLKCKHCSANAEINNKVDLSTENAKIILDKLDEFGVPIVNFTGGEALIRDDIFELFSYANKKGISVGLDTNGTLITRDVAKKMKESGVRKIRVSLDGADPLTHDSFRSLDGAFSKSIDGIKNALSEEIRVEVATVAIRQNHDEIMDLISLCEKLKIDKYMVGPFVPVGRGESVSQDNYELNSLELEELWKSIYDKMKKSEIEIIAGHPNMIRVASQVDGCRDFFPTYAMNHERYKGVESLIDYWGGCSAGRITITIHPNGDIIPCSFVQIVVGNIFKDDLRKLWKENKVFNDLRNRNLLKNGCGDCKFRYSCGGCRGQAFSRTGDYLESDSTCIRNINMVKK